MPNAIPKTISLLIKQALEEDIGKGDITGNSVVPASKRAKAIIIAKENLTLAGMYYASLVFKAVDPKIKFLPLFYDGSRIKKGTVIARAEGRLRALLLAERTALNILQRLSGIATLTARYVDEIKGTGAQILDTRKTAPCMRLMEKHAVRMGGGRNHRMGLYDAVLIKDNHIEAAGGIKKAVALARAQNLGLDIEVETETLDEVSQALQANADIIMLDNMGITDIKKAVKLTGGRAKLEASGGVNLTNARKIALTGVDYISVGAITHSAPASDISMEIGS